MLLHSMSLHDVAIQQLNDFLRPNSACMTQGNVARQRTAGIANSPESVTLEHHAAVVGSSLESQWLLQIHLFDTNR